MPGFWDERTQYVLCHGTKPSRRFDDGSVLPILPCSWRGERVRRQEMLKKPCPDCGSTDLSIDDIGDRSKPPVRAALANPTKGGSENEEDRAE